MCIHNEGDRVFRKGSIEPFTVRTETMGRHTIINKYGAIYPRTLAGDELMSVEEALNHFSAGLAAAADEYGSRGVVRAATDACIAVSAAIATRRERDREAAEADDPALTESWKNAWTRLGLLIGAAKLTFEAAEVAQ